MNAWIFEWKQVALAKAHIGLGKQAKAAVVDARGSDKKGGGGREGSTHFLQNFIFFARIKKKLILKRKKISFVYYNKKNMSECSICSKPSQLICSKNCGATFCSKTCARQAKPCDLTAISGPVDAEYLLKLSPLRMYYDFNKGTTMPEEVKLPAFQRKYVPMHSSAEWDQAFAQSFYDDFTFVKTFLPAVLKMKAWKPTKRTELYLLNYAAHNDQLEIFKLLLSISSEFKTSTNTWLEDAALANSTKVLDYLITELNMDPTASKALKYAVKYNVFESVRRLLADKRVQAKSVRKVTFLAMQYGSVESLQLLLPFVNDISKQEFERVLRNPDVDDRIKDIVNSHLTQESNLKRLKVGLKI